MPPVALLPVDQLDDLMQQGYKLRKERQWEAACDRWLEAWELVKQLTRPKFQTTTAFDKAYPCLPDCIFNWCQEIGDGVERCWVS